MAIDLFIPFIHGSSLSPSGGGGGSSCVGLHAGENSLARCMLEARWLEQSNPLVGGPRDETKLRGEAHLVGHGVVERLGDPVEEAHAQRRHTLAGVLIWRQGRG